MRYALLREGNNYHRYMSYALVFVVTGSLGAYLTFSSHAATLFTSAEAESGTLTGNASLISDANASGGSAIKFGSTSGPQNGLLTSDPNFFPIAVWCQTPESNGARYKAIGVNTFVCLYNGTTDSNMSSLSSQGMYAINDQDSVGLTDQYASTVMKAWLQPDEPDNAQSNGSGGYNPCIPVSTLQSNYNTWKAADSQHRPVMQGFGRGVADVNWGGRGTCTGNTQYYIDAKTAADIFAYDVYPINEGLPLYYVSQGMDNLRGWVATSGFTRPVWMDIETTNYGNTQGPTPAQTKFEVWSAIIHGAKGIDYFCHIFSPSFNEAGLLADSNMSSAVSAIDSQIQSLAAVINIGTPVGDSITSSAGSSVPVDTMTVSYNGSTYIFAAAMRGAATTATYRPSGITSGTVTVLGENRTLTLSGGQFSDTFAGYDTHIYKIN
jgi:hypothetical protein